MNKSITQDNQSDNQISKSIRRFFTRFHLSSALKAAKKAAKKADIPAKVVYVHNKNKRNEYLCLISTDVGLSEDEIIRIYGKRWDIEVFFKVCKSYLNLSVTIQNPMSFS